jgi:hypothetical protein
MTAPLLNSVDIETIKLTLDDLDQALNVPEFTEEEARIYCQNLGPILEALTINKHDIKPRVINFIANDQMLREMLPPGLPDEYYNQAYHQEIHKRVLAELRRLTGHIIHIQTYGHAAGKNNLDAFMFVDRCVRAGSNYVVRGDFRKCYDNVNLQQLYDEVLIPLLPDRPALRELLIILQVLPRYWRVFDEWETELKGILQGLSPSPHLLNLYLRQFDDYCFGITPNYVRIYDDFVLCCASKDDADQALASIRNYIRSHYPSLVLHSDKTGVVTPGKLQFSGYGYAPETLQITLADKAKLQLRIKYDDLADMLRTGHQWRAGCPNRENISLDGLRDRLGQMIRSTQRQFSIVQDEAFIAETWTYINRKLCSAFQTRFPGVQEKRQAFHKLGVRYGVSRDLLRGTLHPDPVTPFSIDKLGDLLLNAWYQY